MKLLNNNLKNNYDVRIEDLTFDFAKSIVFLRKDLVSSEAGKELRGHL